MEESLSAGLRQDLAKGVLLGERDPSVRVGMTHRVRLLPPLGRGRDDGLRGRRGIDTPSPRPPPY